MTIKGFSAGENVLAYLSTRSSPWEAERRAPPGAAFTAALADASGSVVLALTSRIEYTLFGASSGRIVHVLDSTTRPPKGTPV